MDKTEEPQKVLIHQQNGFIKTKTGRIPAPGFHKIREI